MNYIVMDLEWNQPYYRPAVVVNSVALHSEVIQIGAVKLDEQFKRVDSFKILISPKYYKKMHKKVAKLTGITNESLQLGLPFATALPIFKRWCGEDFVFLTWGPDDISVLKDNLRVHRLDDGWLPPCYDAQLIFDRQITKENRQVSLESAMEKVGESALQLHDALHDALNTAAIMRHLDIPAAIEQYHILLRPLKSGDENHTYLQQEDIKGSYAQRAQAAKAPDAICFACPICGSTVLCTNPRRQNSEKHVSVGRCEEGHELFVRIKTRRLPNGRFCATRIVYPLTDENRDYYRSLGPSVQE